MTHPPGRSGGLVRPALLLAGILLIAANLRAALAAVGPVLPDIAADLRLTAVEQGLLVALPVAAFAVFSPLTHPVSARLGTERTLLGALLLLVAGVLVRSAPTHHEVALWTGTAAIGAAIAACNVLLPVLVRSGFPDRGAAVSGYYIAGQSIAAAAASLLAVPLAAATGSWRLAVAVWLLLVVGAFVTWRPRMVAGDPRAAAEVPPPRPPPQVWRSPLAWQVAGYFGLQSACFYLLMSWLPSIEQDMGISPAAAGAHLAVLLVVGIVATLVVPPFLDGRRDQRLTAAAVPVGVLVALAGLVTVPRLAVLWVAVAGFALSAAMVLSLAMINIRAGRPEVTSRLSSMVQGTAYTAVAAALVGAGLVREAVGPGRHVLGLVAACAVCLLLLAPWAGRDRSIGADAGAGSWDHERDPLRRGRSRRRPGSPGR